MNLARCVVRLLGLFADAGAPSLEVDARRFEYEEEPFAAVGSLDCAVVVDESGVVFLGGGFRRVELGAAVFCWSNRFFRSLTLGRPFVETPFADGNLCGPELGPAFSSMGAETDRSAARPVALPAGGAGAFGIVALPLDRRGCCWRVLEVEAM